MEWAHGPQPSRQVRFQDGSSDCSRLRGHKPCRSGQRPDRAEGQGFCVLHGFGFKDSERPVSWQWRGLPEHHSISAKDKADVVSGASAMLEVCPAVTSRDGDLNK